jgi:HAMP domain-containing protein
MEVIRMAPDVTVSSVEMASGDSVFNFDTPILFQDKEVGRIFMGVSKDGLEEVMAITRTLMIALGIVTVLAVVVMLYVFGGMLARPMRRLRQAMLALGAGDLDQRISDTRRDELGELFSAFNRMAEGVHGQVAGAAGTAPDEPAPDRPIPAMWRDEDPDEPVPENDLTFVATGPAVPRAIEATVISPAPGPAPMVDRNNPFLENDPFNEGRVAPQADDPFAEEDPFAEDDEKAVRSPHGKR